jgi:SAM-dependent methyltransferase
MSGEETDSEFGGRPRGRSRNPAYLPPKDALEGDRLNLQHRILQDALQGNFAVPLEQGVANILDVGSGTGIWGEEMALDFPGARIVNVDVDPFVPTVLARERTVRPPNFHFVQSNILQGLPFPDGVFDFTHQRMLVGAIPIPEWSNVVRELIRVTRPGGWIELLEVGNTFNNAGPATIRLMGWTMDLVAPRGMDFGFMEQLGRVADEAGLEVQQVRHLDLPLGTWDSHVGVLMEKNLLMAFEMLGPMVCEALNVAAADHASALQAAPAEWASNRVTCRFHLVQGQA